MLPMSEDFLIDLSPSCTKEQAVLRLLGWGTETIKKKYITMNQSGQVVIEKGEISSTTIELHELLTETYQEALRRFEDAVPKDPTEDEMEKIINEHGPRIEEAEAFIQEAHNYLMDITDELAKNDSALRIDQEASAKTGSTCITIRSLDEWAAKRYQKPEFSSTSENEKSLGAPDDFGGSDRTNNSAFLTMGLMIRILVAPRGAKYGTADDPKISNVAELIFSEVGNIFPKQDKSILGQGLESIRKRLTKANNLLNLTVRNL